MTKLMEQESEEEGGYILKRWEGGMECINSQMMGIFIQIHIGMHIEPPTINIENQSIVSGIKVRGLTNSSSQHTSQEGQEERVVDENDLNDDHCFKCSKKGELYCCDRCFRAFHKFCTTTKRFSKVWNCEYCSSRSHCLTCLQTLREPDPLNPRTQVYTCTICFRPVHKDCCSLPKQLMEAHNHFFSGSSNFVCEICIKQFGFKIVLSYQRVAVGLDEKLYYFVIINTRSPIHCGWFEENALRDVPRCKQADELREVEVYEVPAIDRIIRMKFPPQFKVEDYDEVLTRLLQKGFVSSPYGRGENFYCLVVWEGRDLSGATWEDQNVVAIHNANNAACRQMAKYLLYRKLEMTIREKKALTNAYCLFDKYLPNPPVRMPASQASLYDHFKSNFNNASTAFCLYGVDSQHYNYVVDFLCFSLQEKYHGSLVGFPTILVCSSVPRWEHKLKELCPQLNVLVLKGGQPNVYELKMKELYFQNIQQTKFQVLIIPHDRWSKEKKYLATNPFPLTTLFFDLAEPELIDDQLTSDKPPLSYDRRLFFVENRRMLNRMLLTNRSRGVINLADSHEDTLVYDFCSGQVLNSDLREVTRHVDANEELSRIGRVDEGSFKSGKWNQLKRLVFLRFVLAFGFARSPEEQFRLLISYDKGAFSREAVELERMRRHCERFLAALWDYKNLLPREEYLHYYFFDIPVSSVFKRVSKLAQLKQLVEQHKNSCENFPQTRKLKVFADISVLEVGLWKGQHDFLLAALVLERGFGKWVEIAQDRQWQKWTSSCHLHPFGSIRKPTSATFGQFLKDIIYMSNKQEIKTFVKVNEIIKERGQYLLSLSK